MNSITEGIEERGRDKVSDVRWEEGWEGDRGRDENR